MSVLFVAGSGNEPGPQDSAVYGFAMTSDASPSSTRPSPATGVQALRERAGKLWARVRRQPIRNGAVLGGILLITVAGAPLAARVWEAFWSLPYAGRVALCGVGLTVILVATVRRPYLQWNRWRQRATQARLGSLIVLAWTVVVVIVGLLVTGTWWAMGAPAPDFPDTLRPRALDTLTTRAFAIVAGFGAAALLVIHYRRQRTTEADADREVARLFTETFDSASDKLGSEHAAVRLAGVHALARLADEAPEGREDLVQMIIDVLCAYLRMPYTPARRPLTGDATAEQAQTHHEHELEFASSREVRHTVIRIIGDRLRKDTRWRGKDYDFTGVVFDGGDLTGAHFVGGTVSFLRAEFTEGDMSFFRAQFASGRVDFALAKFAGGRVDFALAKFDGGPVSFGWAEFTGGTVNFNGARFTDKEVSFGGAMFTGGEVSFGAAQGTCPHGLLEAIKCGKPGVVLLDKHWRHGEQDGPATFSATPDH